MDKTITIPKKEIAPGVFTTGGTATVPSSVITPQDLQPTTPINLQTPPTEIPNIAGDIQFFNQLQNQQTAEQKALTQQKDSANVGIENLLKEISGKGQEQLSLEQQVVNPMQSQLASLTGDIGTQIAEFQQAQALYEKAKSDIEAGAGRKGITTSAVMGQQGAIDRAKASELNVKASNIAILQAQAQALQGRVDLAQRNVDRAIDLKYSGKEQELAIRKFQLDNIKESLSASEKKQAEAMNFAIQKEEKRIAEQKENEKAIQSIALKIAEFGGNPSIVKDAKTPMEAIQLAGSKLQDPRSRLELQKLALDIQKSQRELALIGQPTEKERKAEADALKTKEGQNLVLQDKLDLIDTIKKNSGISTRVGANIATRKATGFGGVLGRGLAGAVAGGIAGLPFGGVGAIPGAIVGAGVGLLKNVPNEVTGKGQQFAGAVHRLASQEFIDNLIAAKQQGATFGALTDREGDALRAAATQLNDWEIKDKDGKGTGVWNIDEKSFLGELNRIETLTRKAIGSEFTQDEDTLLDSVFGSDTTLQADPSVYFNQ